MTKKCIRVFKVIAVLLAAVVGYVIYLYASYHRIEDSQTLSVEGTVDQQKKLTTEEVYTALTYNIGFGAYTPDFSFFMDGGKDSRAKSKESVVEMVGKAGELAISFDPDFVLVQEIDLDGTRSHHVNEYELLKETFAGYQSVFAQNYDSAYLLFPPTNPHGSNKSGIGLFSGYPITEAVRRSFPIATSWKKFLDLDRCYSISRLPVDNGKELVIFTLHMSAYGNSDQVRQAQVSMLCQDMEKEYERGNYILCGGDFNYDLKAEEDDSQGHESWAYPFPRGELPEYIHFAMDELPEQERNELWNSSRNTDIEYTPGVSYTVMLDGFLISDNLEMVSYECINTGYAYSDHEPVILKFRLKAE